VGLVHCFSVVFTLGQASPNKFGIPAARTACSVWADKQMALPPVLALGQASPNKFGIPAARTVWQVWADKQMALPPVLALGQGFPEQVRDSG
jgi:hypothetical protein